MEMDSESSSAQQKSSSDLKKKNNMLHQSLDLIMLIITTNKASVNNLTVPEIPSIKSTYSCVLIKELGERTIGKYFII